jgi:hypothetical protein
MYQLLLVPIRKVLYEPNCFILCEHLAGSLLCDALASCVRFLALLLFTTAVCRPALGPTQLPIQWLPGAVSVGVKRPVRDADHSPPSSAEVKNALSYTSTPPIRLHGMVLIYKKRALSPLLLNFALEYTFSKVQEKFKIQWTTASGL